MAKVGAVRAGSAQLPEKFLGGTKRMKKIIALLLALVMVFALVACSSKTTDDTAKDDTTAPADTTETTDTTGDTEARRHCRRRQVHQGRPRPHRR